MDSLQAEIDKVQLVPVNQNCNTIEKYSPNPSRWQPSIVIVRAQKLYLTMAKLATLLGTVKYFSQISL